MTSVVTLTPAPVLDRTYLVDSYAHGKVNRSYEVHEYMSGKGLNVARTLHLARVPVAGILPIGKDDEHLLFRTPYPHILRIVPIAGRVRVNTTVVERGGTTTNVNQTAIPLSSHDWRRICDLADEQVREMDADWLVVSGVHPLNEETGEHVDLQRLFEQVRARGVRVALDTSGPPLARWIRSGLVNLVKPNADELANLVGRNLFTIHDALDAGHELNALGIEVALVSLGVDGALAVSADSEYWGRAKASQVTNTTGAGDATLAGFLAHSLPQTDRGAAHSVDETPADAPALTIPDALAHACSWGALAVSLPTTLISSFEHAPRATVSAPEPNRALREPTHLS